MLNILFSFLLLNSHANDLATIHSWMAPLLDKTFQYNGEPLCDSVTINKKANSYEISFKSNDGQTWQAPLLNPNDLSGIKLIDKSNYQISWNINDNGVKKTWKIYLAKSNSELVFAAVMLIQPGQWLETYCGLEP